MSDLIERQKVIDALKDWYDGMIISSFRGVEKVIKALPSAQPIIRCKDCEHWDTTWQNDFAPNYHYCPLVDGTRRDDFYCADAEMRGEQDE